MVRSSDAIESLVCGYSRFNRESKHILVMQAFIDDSQSSSSGREFVLAGYMASAPVWMQFSDEWSKALAELPSIDYFHATEAESRKDEFLGWDVVVRNRKVMKLAEIIDRFPLFSFDCRVGQDSFGRILRDASPYDLRSPYFSIFYGVIATAARQLHMHGIAVPIDFIFDEQGDVGPEAALWYNHVRLGLPSHLRPLLGGRPIFRSDRDIVPLQAADMLAWHLRRSREPRNAHEKRPALNILRKNGHTEAHISDTMLESWARRFATVPGIEDVKGKRGSVKQVIIQAEKATMKMPKAEQENAYEEFNRAMDTILKANPVAVKAAMEADKMVRARKRKSKKTPASGRVLGGKG